MLTATIRGMLAHRLRLALTTASIALGVAFLAGTFVLTDTMGLAFSQLFGKVSAGTDAVVRTEAPYSATDGRAILTKGGAPTQGYSMAADEQLRGDVELLSGTAPTTGREVAIDAT